MGGWDAKNFWGIGGPKISRDIQSVLAYISFMNMLALPDFIKRDQLSRLTSLVTSIPVDDHGRPVCLYLPRELDKYAESQNLAEVPKTLSLIYIEGIPSIDGHPIWEILPGENPKEFELYREYRDGTSRRVDLLAHAKGIPLIEMQIISQSRCWYLRTRSFDCYISMVRYREKQRQKDIVDQLHFKIGTALLEKSTDALMRNLEADLLSDKALVMLARVASDLANKPFDKNNMQTEGAASSNAANPTLMPQQVGPADDALQVYDNPAELMNIQQKVSEQQAKMFVVENHPHMRKKTINVDEADDVGG